MKYSFAFALLLLTLAGCIGDDIIADTVEERVVIINPIDSMELNTTYAFNARFFNQIGQVEEQPVVWSSTEPTVVSIDNQGMATALAEGNTEIVATIQKDGADPIEARQNVAVAAVVTNPGNMERTGSLQTTSSYALTGDFTMNRVDGELTLNFADNYRASSALPGLYVYLTNNPNSISDALELGMVTVFQGAHSYTLPQDVEMNAYSHLLYFCKPFSVKVGDGAFDN